MKKIILISLLVIVSMSYAKTQDTLFIMKDGTVIFQKVTSEIDSIIFYKPDTGEPSEPSEPTGTSVTDIEGNTYQAVTIGNQTWMAENLATTKYNDDTEIPHAADTKEWSSLSTPGYCWYDNDETKYKEDFGALYNFYAVETGKLCPSGWHVPSDDEWKELEMYLGMSQSDADKTEFRGTNQGSKLAGNAALWLNGALKNNADFGSSGFTAVPGGLRYGYDGSFVDIKGDGCWWSSSGNDESTSWRRGIWSGDTTVGRFSYSKKDGFSVRCLKD